MNKLIKILRDEAMSQQRAQGDGCDTESVDADYVHCMLESMLNNIAEAIEHDSSKREKIILKGDYWKREDDLKSRMIGTKFEILSERALQTLWEKFSSIQASNWLIVTKENLERFEDWLESGKDEDAWS